MARRWREDEHLPDNDEKVIACKKDLIGSKVYERGHKKLGKEKNAAFNEMEKLINRESSEATLEMLIKSLGYSDALVRIEDDKVAVSVMSDEVSKEQVNEIVYKVLSEMGEGLVVSVDFQPFN